MRKLKADNSSDVKAAQLQEANPALIVSQHLPIKILICFLPKSRPKIDEMVSPITIRKV